MAKKISQHTLDTRVREVLKLVSRVSKTGIPENAPEGSRDIPETASLLRRLSGESIILLKNENAVLPLKKANPVSLK
jgi:beta-glucosidase